MGALLMSVGAGVCGLAVLAFLGVVGVVLWQGERLAGLELETTGVPDLDFGDVEVAGPQRRRNRRPKVHISTRHRRLAGAVVVALFLMGVAGSILWVVGYLLVSTGPDAARLTAP